MKDEKCQNAAEDRFRASTSTTMPCVFIPVWWPSSFICIYAFIPSHSIIFAMEILFVKYRGEGEPDMKNMIVSFSCYFNCNL